MQIRFEPGSGSGSRGREVWLAAVVALSIFALWIGPAAESNFEPQTRGGTAAVRHHVSMGVLGYVNVEARRHDAGTPWSFDVDFAAVSGRASIE